MRKERERGWWAERGGNEQERERQRGRYGQAEVPAAFESGHGEKQIE